jgi:hypothetical protein
MNIARTIGLLALCAVLANCAGAAAYLTSSAEPTQGVDMAYWSGHRAPMTDGRIAAADVPDSKPPTQYVTARRKLEPLNTTGLAHSDSNASLESSKGAAPSTATPTSGSAKTGKTTTAGKGAAPSSDWFTPDWYAREQAESDRIKKLTNICRC